MPAGPLFAASAVSTAHVVTDEDTQPLLRWVALAVLAWLILLWLKR